MDGSGRGEVWERDWREKRERKLPSGCKTEKKENETGKGGKEGGKEGGREGGREEREAE